jgi:chemotaxis protein methyltransferase CheR
MTGFAPSPAIAGIVQFFEEASGQRLSESRLWRVEIILKGVLQNHGLKDLGHLHEAISKNSHGPIAAATIHALMNHESSFFRDLNVFVALEHQILPALHRSLSQKTLRIWCAGCSTGQEAYSLAMILKRQEAMWRDWRVSILGTDISPIAVAAAQSGRYPQMDVQRGLAIGDLLRWFEPVDGLWQISPEIQSLITFRTDNVLAPCMANGVFDLILCRNVLLYFEQEQRAQALAMLARHSRPETVLLLGAGETTIGMDSQFMPSADYRGLYQLCASPEQARTPQRRAAG